MPAPFVDRLVLLRQPDGTAIEALLTGNQFVARARTPEGRPILWDPARGRHVLASSADALLPLRSEAAAGMPSVVPRWQQRLREEASRAAGGPGAALAPPTRATLGPARGLCALVDFADEKRTIDRDEVARFCNQPGYTGGGNRGSVHDYFWDVSNHKFDYTNVVTEYVRAQHPRAYYADRGVHWPDRAVELVGEIVAALVKTGFDPRPLTVDGKDFVRALNVLYAGPLYEGYQEGLWPHAWAVPTPLALGTRRWIHDYQITNMGKALTLGTFCHENGHMMCDFPDLAERADAARGVGGYSLMGVGGDKETNPTHVDGYLKLKAGWAEVRTAQAGVVTLHRRGNHVFLHRRNQDEYFVLENRRPLDRDAELADDGLAVWRVDQRGNNFEPKGGPYECALVQADGLRELESGQDRWGDADDLFRRGGKDGFGPATVPSSAWADGTASGLSVTGVSAPGEVLTFRV